MKTNETPLARFNTFSPALGIFMQAHRTCRKCAVSIPLLRVTYCRYKRLTCVHKSRKRYIDFCSRARSRWRR